MPHIIPPSEIVRTALRVALHECVIEQADYEHAITWIRGLYDEQRRLMDRVAELEKCRQRELSLFMLDG